MCKRNREELDHMSIDQDNICVVPEQISPDDYYCTKSLWCAFNPKKELQKVLDFQGFLERTVPTSGDNSKYYGHQMRDFTVEFFLFRHTISEMYYKLSFLIQPINLRELPINKTEKLDFMRAICGFTLYFAEIDGSKSFAEYLYFDKGLRLLTFEAVSMINTMFQALYESEQSFAQIFTYDFRYDFINLYLRLETIVLLRQ